jgi:hypothetical protein
MTYLTDNQHFIPTGSNRKPVYDLRMLIELNEADSYSGSAVDLYSEDARFEPRPRRRLSWLRFLIVFLRPYIIFPV